MEDILLLTATTLVLDDFAFYGDKARATVGVGALKGLLTQLSKELQKQGYAQLIIRGVRYSGANPGRTAIIVVAVPPPK